ncbi:MAG: FAD-dependent oxidoreductase [Pseudomonadota bacterium]
MTESLVIIGAGHAAGQLIGSLVSGGYEGEITLIGEEAYLPYQRPPLSKKYLQGELPRDRLFLKPEAFYASSGVRQMLGRQVTAVDTTRQSVTLDNGDSLAYDKLVFATGSRVRRLSVPGADDDALMYLRSIADVDAISAKFEAGRHIAVIGGGYIGLEVAAVAASAGLKVTLIELENRLLSRVASPSLSAFYETVHRDAGVNILLGTGVQGFESTADGLRIALSNDTHLDADFAVAGIGVSAESALAEDAGIACDNGILVDGFCKTDVDSVFAIGDCTNHPNPILGKRLRLESVPNALAQARIAAAAIMDKSDQPYAEVPWFWSDQYDLKLQMVGLTEGFDETVMRGSMDERKFACFYLKNGTLIAVDAVNSPREFMMSKAAIAGGARIPKEVLADPAETLKDAASLWPPVAAE